MKIIAITTDGFFCQVSGRELSLLGIHKPSMGAEIELERAFDTLASLRNVSRSELSKISYQISELQARFKEIDEAYNKATILLNIGDSK